MSKHPDIDFYIATIMILGESVVRLIHRRIFVQIRRPVIRLYNLSRVMKQKIIAGTCIWNGVSLLRDRSVDITHILQFLQFRPGDRQISFVSGILSMDHLKTLLLFLVQNRPIIPLYRLALFYGGLPFRTMALGSRMPLSLSIHWQDRICFG